MLVFFIEISLHLKGPGYMRDFSPFVTVPGLKFQLGVMVRVLSQRSCDYMGKGLVGFPELKFQPTCLKRTGVFRSNELSIYRKSSN